MEMEQTFEGSHSVPDEHSQAETNCNNIHALGNGSVSNQDENSFNEDIRQVIETSPRCGLGSGQENTQADLAGVVGSSPDDQHIVMSSTTEMTDEILVDKSDQLDDDTPPVSSTNQHDELAPSAKHDNTIDENVEVNEEDFGSSTLADESKPLDQEGSSTASNAYTLIRSKKVLDIPNNFLDEVEDKLVTYALGPTVPDVNSDLDILAQRTEGGTNLPDEDKFTSFVSKFPTTGSVTEILIKQLDDVEMSDEEDMSRSYASRLSTIPSVSDTLINHQSENCDLPDNDNAIRDETTEICTDNVVKEPSVTANCDASCDRRATYNACPSGRKCSGISSKINKYNTLQHNDIPPTDNEMSKPKSIKSPHCQDNIENEELEVAFNVPTNDDAAFDDVPMTLDTEKCVQESNQKGDDVTVNLSTGIDGDSLDTTNNTNKIEDNENKTNTIEGNGETSERCDANRNNCGDISLAVTNNKDSKDIDLASEKKTANNTERLNLVGDKGVQEKKLSDKMCKAAAVEEVGDTNFVECTSGCNSIFLGSTLDSLDEIIDADDEFSSQEESRCLTPTSPLSTDGNETVFRTGMICHDELKVHSSSNTKTVIAEELSAKDKVDNECNDGCYNVKKEEIHTVSHLTLGNRVAESGAIPLTADESHKVSDIQGFGESSSHAATHARTIEPNVETLVPIGDNTHAPSDINDTELVYLDAESGGDLNEQSEASCEQLLSCCNSGYQSPTDVPECIQLYANEDMKSIESSSLYDDVLSAGSPREYLSIKNHSDGSNRRHLSGRCSEIDSCSNFYSDEGDHKQSDNQEGYLSAWDAGEGAEVLSSAESLEFVNAVNEGNVSTFGGNEHDVEIAVKDKHDEHLSDTPCSPEKETLMDCMSAETETVHGSSDCLQATMDPTEKECKNVTASVDLPEEAYENISTNFDKNKDEKQVGPNSRNDIISQLKMNSLKSPVQESDIKVNNIVSSAEDTAETATEIEVVTKEVFDCFPTESHCTAYKEETTNSLVDTVEQIDTPENNVNTEEESLNESTLVNTGASQEKADEEVTTQPIANSAMPDCVELNVLLNANLVCDRDSSSEDHYSGGTSLDNAFGSGSSVGNDLEEASIIEPITPYEERQEGATHEDGSEDDEETKDACCKEFQLIWKRMRKLKKTMESLNDQVSREKCYLEEEVDRYKNLPEVVNGGDMTVFEQKLAEVQRERWLQLQPANITQEEYWRRLKEADQMCGQEIQQMNVAEEKLRHLTRITDVWMRTNVVLPYYDPPSLDLEPPAEVDTPEVTQKKVDELATEVVDMIGPSDAYMTSWLINEADRMKANYPKDGKPTSKLQNLNDLSVDEMLLPPHLLERLEVLRDVVKANSSTEIIHKNYRFDEQKDSISNLTVSQDLHLNQSIDRDNQTTVPEKIKSDQTV